MDYTTLDPLVRLGLANDRKAARMFAFAAHAGQLYSGLPYGMHLDGVVGLLIQHGRADLAVAGYLHDVPEDQPHATDSLRVRFPDAWPIVWACTGEGHNRKARVASIAAKHVGLPDAQTVKVADRLANGTHSLLWNSPQRAMYAGEADAFMRAVPLAEPSLLAALRALHALL